MSYLNINSKSHEKRIHTPYVILFPHSNQFRPSIEPLAFSSFVPLFSMSIRVVILQFIIQQEKRKDMILKKCLAALTEKWGLNQDELDHISGTLFVLPMEI